jgi:hypothetical protein
MSRQSDEPDVEIGAVVKAKRLRFNKTPKTEVQFEKEKKADARIEEALPEIETASGSRRENLPDKVEPGVTYRDVHVRWGAAAKLRLPDRKKLEAALEDLEDETRD